MKRADALSGIQLLDSGDRAVRLGDLWRDQTAVVIWLRHFG
ncbi:MAG: hypothetical protein ACRDJ5_00960 [Actinomycetota bacterium]